MEPGSQVNNSPISKFALDRNTGRVQLSRELSDSLQSISSVIRHLLEPQHINLSCIRFMQKATKDVTSAISNIEIDCAEDDILTSDLSKVVKDAEIFLNQEKRYFFYDTAKKISIVGLVVFGSLYFLSPMVGFLRVSAWSFLNLTLVFGILEYSERGNRLYCHGTEVMDGVKRLLNKSWDRAGEKEGDNLDSQPIFRSPHSSLQYQPLTASSSLQYQPLAAPPPSGSLNSGNSINIAHGSNSQNSVNSNQGVRPHWEMETGGARAKSPPPTRPLPKITLFGKPRVSQSNQ
jgi:hypothetical protein